MPLPMGRTCRRREGSTAGPSGQSGEGGHCDPPQSCGVWPAAARALRYRHHPHPSASTLERRSNVNRRPRSGRRRPGAAPATSAMVSDCIPSAGVSLSNSSRTFSSNARFSARCSEKLCGCHHRWKMRPCRAACCSPDAAGPAGGVRAAYGQGRRGAGRRWPARRRGPREARRSTPSWGEARCRRRCRPAWPRGAECLWSPLRRAR